MIERIAAFVSERIAASNHNNDDKEIYNYGLQIMLNTLFSICAVLLLGAVLHELSGTVLFLLSYCSVRLFAGGLHASTNNKCMTIFIGGYVVTYLILRNLSVHLDFVIISFLIILNLLILLWAPVDALNNPISQANRKIMKKRALLNSILISSLIFFLLYNGYAAGKWGFAGLVWICLIMVTGKFNNILLLNRGTYRHE